MEQNEANSDICKQVLSRIVGYSFFLRADARELWSFPRFPFSTNEGALTLKYKLC